LQGNAKKKPEKWSGVVAPELTRSEHSTIMKTQSKGGRLGRSAWGKAGRSKMSHGRSFREERRNDQDGDLVIKGMPIQNRIEGMYLGSKQVASKGKGGRRKASVNRLGNNELSGSWGN